MKSIIKSLTSSNKDLRNSRGGRLAKSLFFAFDTSVVRRLNSEVLELEGKLEDLTDLGRTNVNQLDTDKKAQDANNWAAQVHKVALELDLKKAELTSAESTFKALFGTEADFNKQVAKFTDEEE